MRRAATALVAVAALGAVPLAGCGGTKPQIPRADARQLISLLEDARRQASAQPPQCDALTKSVRKLQQRAQGLPGNTDSNVRDSLTNGINNLSDLASQQCSQTQTTDTNTTDTTATTTSATTPPPPPTNTTPTTNTNTDTQTNTTPTTTGPVGNGGTNGPGKGPNGNGPPGQKKKKDKAGKDGKPRDGKHGHGGEGGGG